MGLMPTLMRIRSEELVHPNAAMRRTLREALGTNETGPGSTPPIGPRTQRWSCCKAAAAFCVFMKNNNKIMPIP